MTMRMHETINTPLHLLAHWPTAHCVSMRTKEQGNMFVDMY
jgi:hypothetical protein